MVMGSPSFIAPERVRGEWASPASDLWSLGATLYTATEGHPPYVRGNPLETLMAVRNDDPAPPRHAGPLAHVLMGLMARDVALRMAAEQAAEEFAQVLQHAKPLPPPGPDAAVQGAPRPAPLNAGPYADQPHAPEGPRLIPEPSPAAAAPSPAKKWKTPLFAGLAVIAAAAVVSFLLLRPTGGKTHPSSVVPAGFQRASGPEATTLAVPAGWLPRALSPASLQWTEPATGAYIQVDATSWGVQDPAEHWRRFQHESAHRKPLPALRVLRRSGTFLARGWATADLEFTSGVSSHHRLRGYGRAFTVGGHQYTILIVARAARWNSRYVGVLTTAFNAFQPTIS
jgi:hypothetical protein